MSEKGEAPDAGSTGVPPTRWGLGEAALAFLAGTILSVLFGGVAQAATGYHPGQGKAIPLGVTAASLIGLWAGLGGGAVFATRARGSGRLAHDLGLRLRWPLDPALGVGAGLVSSLVLVPLLYLPFEQIVPDLQRRLQAPAKQDTAGANGAFAITALLLLLAVGAPIVEELFFRGLLQRSLARRFGPVAAVAMSSALFGLAHFEPLQLPALILFGIVLGGLAQWTGRLGPGIFAHATFNALTVLTFTLSH